MGEREKNMDKNDEDERERENDDEHRNPKVGRLSQKLETCQDLKERKNVLSLSVTCSLNVLKGMNLEP